MVDDALDPAGLARLLEITGGDIEFVDELVDTFLDDAVTQLDALRVATGSGDPVDLVRPAHSLKSSSDNVGASALTALCRALETDARNGPVHDPTARVREIERSFEVARSALLAERAGR